MTARARHRKHIRRVAVEDMAQTIAIDQLIPFNATLLQWFVHWNAIPTFDEAILVKKNAGPGGITTGDDVTLYLINGFEDNINQYIDRQNWEFIKGDYLWVTFANNDNQRVNVEFIFGGAK